MIRRIFLFLLLLVAALVVVLMYNTLTFGSMQVYEPVGDQPRLTDSAIFRFQRAIQSQTVSTGDPALFDSSAFEQFHDFLRGAYPRVHAQLELRKLAGASLLYQWKGSDESLNPYVLMAHQDVVPVEEAARSLWQVEPFAGIIKDESIWGRGTADDKINLIAIMEATERLLANGFVPQRTIYLAFGHDEEVGGTGARAIASYLRSQNITADLVLDEGGPITLDKVPGMKKPVALMGTAEKGYMSLDLTVQKNGGHSSQPEKESAMTIVAKALLAIQEHPFPAGFSEPTEGFVRYVGPEMPYPDRIVFANTWMFTPLVVSIYEQSAAGNALVRTTSAPTIFNSGIKDNIIPTQASATINFRLLPGDSSKKVIARVKEIINDDRVQVSHRAEFVAEPSAVTHADGPGFSLVAKVVHQVFPETVVAPFLMIGATDSRHMEPISTQIIKFSPMTDPIGYHGINERVTIKSFGDSIWFFESLIRSTGQPSQ
jgi:carboxypeptidase PM20D1